MQQKRTAVFVHDFMTDHRLFSRLTPVLQSLSPGHRTVAYDLRGFGKSSNPTDSLYSRFDDLEAAVGTKSDPLDIIGVGFGGAIALEYALARSTQVRSVCCVGSGLPGHAWSLNAMVDITEASETARRLKLMRIRDEEDAAPMSELVRWKQTFISANDTWGRVLRGADRETAKMLLEMAKDYKGFHFFKGECVEPDPFGDIPLLKKLGDVDLPVCVLVGEMDTPDFHAIAKEIWDGVPAKWDEAPFVVPDSGHFAVLEQPQPVAKQITGFWNALGEGSSRTDILQETSSEVE